MGEMQSIHELKMLYLSQLKSIDAGMGNWYSGMIVGIRHALSGIANSYPDVAFLRHIWVAWDAEYRNQKKGEG